MSAHAWRLALAGAALMALVAGGRASFGLFVSPLNTASGMGLAALSLALAAAQLAVGVVQPFVGAAADRFGAGRVIAAGAVLLATTTALPALWPVAGVLTVAVVGTALAGSAVGSNSLLVGELGRAVPSSRAGLAVGIVGAGASAGQLVAAPVAQWVIGLQGWQSALLGMAAVSLAAVPLAAVFRRPPGGASHRPQAGAVGHALRQASFWRVAASFAVCGFHVAFMAVHMPGVIERCGLAPSFAASWIALAGAANIAGSIGIGFAMRRFDPGALLVGLYAIRAAGIAAMLALPPTPGNMLAFAVVMGASHMATLPPTTQLVSRQHGVACLGTLFGVVMLVHQVGSFAGVALGGWLADTSGSDTLLWQVDIALALVAAGLVWPWRPSVSRPAAAAT